MDLQHPQNTHTHTHMLVAHGVYVGSRSLERDRSTSWGYILKGGDDARPGLVKYPWQTPSPSLTYAPGSKYRELEKPCETWQRMMTWVTNHIHIIRRSKIKPPQGERRKKKSHVFLWNMLRQMSGHQLCTSGLVCHSVIAPKVIVSKKKMRTKKEIV